ncbi:MAG: ATP-binding protein [Ignavibacteriaceae bacterium]|jgi:signal transduction histidine kinase
MKSEIKVNARLKDLLLVESTIDANEPLKKVFKILENNESLPGVIVLKDGKYFSVISKSRFFELMSQEFMLELYSKRTIEAFTHEFKEGYTLFISENESILTAASKALNRDVFYRQDPLIVEYENGGLKLLDFYVLLSAQTKVHMLTLNSLKEANEFKKEILNVAAHDLRNPLNAIMGFSSLIEEMAGEDDELKSYAGLIKSSAHNMNELFTELLKTSVNDATEFDLTMSDFDLINLIKSIIFSFKNSFDLKKLSVVLETSLEQITIHADKQKLNEVFENLVSNAIKYSPFHKEIIVRINQTGTNIAVEVEDNGLGLSKDDLSKIFGKYQKLSAKPTNNESSTGLGLFIVKKIIDKHQGEISVKSELGKGSTFTVIVPHITHELNI